MVLCWSIWNARRRSSYSLIATRDWDALFGRIADGGGAAHGSAMPSFRELLTDDETWDVVAFLATFQANAVRPPFWLD